MKNFIYLLFHLSFLFFCSKSSASTDFTNKIDLLESKLRDIESYLAEWSNVGTLAKSKSISDFAHLNPGYSYFTNFKLNNFYAKITTIKSKFTIFQNEFDMCPLISKKINALAIESNLVALETELCNSDGETEKTKSIESDLDNLINLLNDIITIDFIDKVTPIYKKLVECNFRFKFIILVSRSQKFPFNELCLLFSNLFDASRAFKENYSYINLKLLIKLDDCLNHMNYFLGGTLQDLYSLNSMDLLKFLNEHFITNPKTVMHILKSLISSISYNDSLEVSQLYFSIYWLIGKSLQKKISSLVQWEKKVQEIKLFIEILKKAPGVQELDYINGPNIPFNEYIVGLEYLVANSVFDESRGIFDEKVFILSLRKVGVWDIRTEFLAIFHLSQYHCRVNLKIDPKFLATIDIVYSYYQIAFKVKDKLKLEESFSIEYLIHVIGNSHLVRTCLPCLEWKCRAKKIIKNTWYH
jgi:hypothetical protein